MIDKIDDRIASSKFILNIFKHIHPNYITIFGILCNFGILYMLLSTDNVLYLNVLLLFRYFSDILDGAVARHYNKGSVLGGYLDSICDIMLISIFGVFYTSLITTNMFILFSVSYMIILSLIIYFYIKNSLYDHVGLKVNPNSKLEFMIQWMVNNSLVLYLLQMIINVYII